MQTKILAADDDNFCAMSLKVILKSLSMEPVIVGDGAAAFEAYKSNGGFPLIIMDLHMPKMDGFESTVEIRKYEATNRLVPAKILGLSADDDRETVAKAIKSGMNVMLKKPLKKEELSKYL
eukprot:TRINITY_DN0_c950_g1_i1.p1 TRINITY_DN0_c950_g1~~TRINITY_DN0_c950_g1_i1.p1  ORF type:complete len:121 (+),score=32.95 TRINITY_DN0_c950_g1_i1:33-395(+)